MSFKKSLIASISLVLMLFPRLELNGCGPFMFDEEFRVWLFQPNLVNNEALVPFTYSSNLYFHAGNRGEDLSEYFDSSFIQINVVEWQAELPAAKAKDTYNLLYNTEPTAYQRQVKGDSLRQNSFYQALKEKPEHLSYFNFAKNCEAAFGGGNSTDENWTWQKDSIAIRKLVTKAETLLKTTKSPFVRLRTAYQLVKAHEYLTNTEGVRKAFDTYIKDSKSNSWIVGSALFYYAKAQPNPVVRNMFAANCFDRTKDKKLQSLKLINNEQTKTTLIAAQDAHQRAVVGLMLGLRNPGRSLDVMQAVYDADPMQNDFPMLIEREINKLEDWLFSYNVAENETYLSRTIHFPRKKKEGTDELEENIVDNMKPEEYEKARRANWQSDRAYLDNVATFVDKVISEKKIKDPAFALLSGAHLAFMKQDFSKARTYLAALKTQNDAKPNVRVQAELTDVLCDLYEKPQISAATEQKIAQFDAVLQKNKESITDFETFRQQIYIFIGQKLIEQGSIAKGCLTTMLSDRFTKAIVPYTQENGYHRLYGLAKPADFDAALRILTAPKTAFEQLLAAEKRPYIEEDGYYDEKKQEWVEVKKPRLWDLNKIKDYKATYYIRHDQIDSALTVLKTIRRSYWQTEPYHSMLNCNPFYIDIAHPHAATFADSMRYDKISFLEQMVKLRNEATTNPSVSARNYYLLGNAYYNMAWKGNFWLMSDIGWGTGEAHSGYFEKDAQFINNYFGLENAQKQYELCLKNTPDEKLAALCHFMIGYCVQTKAEYVFYQHNNRWDDQAPKPPIAPNPATAIFRNKFKNGLNQYAKLDYWCTNYDKLAKLYSGF